MNALDPQSSDLAVLQYGEGDFRVVRPGRYVLCAVSGVHIPLEALRYWNASLQEAYAGPTEALKRYKDVGNGA
jgi:hypothetical protein